MKIVVIGCSAGSQSALHNILCGLLPCSSLSIVIAKHLPHDAKNTCNTFTTQYHTKVLNDKESLKNNSIYFCPGGYHVNIEADHTLSLSCDERVHYSRPSIDILFETAAEVFKDDCCAVLLSGSNADGSKGMSRVKELGGTCIVQSPIEAEHPFMPQSAIDAHTVDYILTSNKIHTVINTWANENE